MNHMLGFPTSDITPDALFKELEGTSLGDMFRHILGDYLHNIIIQ